MAQRGAVQSLFFLTRGPFRFELSHDRMLMRGLADLVVVVHLAFVAFVVLGGLLAFRWRWIPWLQLPCAAYGVLIEIFGWVCPLTPLENRLRASAGAQGYEGGFVEHYILPVLYPEWLTLPVQIVLAAVVAATNVLIYLVLWRLLGHHRPRRAG